ncbi:uncharacterized protein LOC120847573 [Ixodes scapularis]|uniref:uncharacterized protein LOC120847573 n=1 Tax=Ixodes scapularis TaxID=6945 RepID=UPI001A9D6F78|nr:uncharacterized protein LOC120847573 [Ixodes scapularis]
MIVTGIFLLFVAVPLVCVAEENTETMPPGCVQVSVESFKHVSCEATLSTALGSLCSFIFSKEIPGGKWLGYAGSGNYTCKVCCANQNGNTQHYRVTNAPSTFPCGDGKTCSKGRCPK